MHVNLKFFCLSLGAAALLIGASGVAIAQRYQSQHPAMGQHPTMGMKGPHAAPVSARTLAKFKRAYRSVKSIQNKYVAKLQAHKMKPMGKGKAARQLRRWARTSMVNAVKSAGLTVRQFDHLMGLMRREPALRKQVLGH